MTQQQIPQIIPQPLQITVLILLEMVLGDFKGIHHSQPNLNQIPHFFRVKSSYR